MKMLLGLLVAAALQLPAAVKLPAVISANMVLQQGMPVRIWGEGSPGESVTVAMAGQTVRTKTDTNGDWQVYLHPLAAGGPYDMTISGANTITVPNVLVGEVWVASGQSNMGWTLKNSRGSDQEIPESNYPQIRFFRVKTTSLESPARDTPEAEWKVSNPDNSPAFSGVAYFFAKHLHQTRGVPVGILQSAAGGTPAQAWTSHPALANDRNLAWYLDRWEQYVKDYRAKADDKTPPARPGLPMGAPGHIHTPSGLFNGMIAPLLNYGIKGAIWYQGEANAGPTENELYRRLFSEMILDWRRAWQQGPFPFLWVQLANYGVPKDRNWAVLRDSQSQTLELANTAQALAIDVGESKDIHPKDKATVGKRLALAARAVAYGEKIVYSGPVMRMVTGEDGALRVWFNHAGSGLATTGGTALTGFYIAGSDGAFVEAEAKLDGETAIVSSSQVPAPVAVRYAWENDPAANLINKEGLPATPFRAGRPF